MLEIKSLSDIVSTLAEGPLWQPQTSSVTWTDIPNNVIHTAELISGKSHSLQTPTLVSAIVESHNGDFIVGTKEGIAKIGLNGDFELVEEFLDSDMRMNDGKVDPRGNFWLGSLALDFQAHRGSLFEFDVHGKRRVIEEKVTLSNGMGWSPDLQSFYYIDSIPGVLYRYDYDISTGTISNKSILVEFDSSKGIPDGLCISKDGLIVIAMWDGRRLEILDAQGKKIEEYLLPVSRPTSCCFAGDDYSTLVVTTASQDIDRVSEPLAGKVLVLTGTGLSGLPSYKYG